jgi:hypothetical protein
MAQTAALAQLVFKVTLARLGLRASKVMSEQLDLRVQLAYLVLMVLQARQEQREFKAQQG